MNKKNTPPRFTGFLFKFLLTGVEYENRSEELNEVFNYIALKHGRSAAVRWYRKQFIKSLPSLLINSTYWGGALFGNYIKSAYRNLKSNKLFSFINVTGLALGIATCLIISIWIQRELSYDRFHSKSERIFRVERELFRDQVYSRWPIVGGQYKQALIDDIPEIENAVRFWGRNYTVIDFRKNIHQQGMFAVDNSIFDIFDFELLAGDKKTALARPNSIVLTKDKAEKYLGTSDAIGKPLTLEFDDRQEQFEVTGILKEVPENSHIQFSVLISISTYPDERYSDWRSNYLYTYVLLDENAEKAIVENKLKKFVETRLEPHYEDLLVEDYTIHQVLKMHIFPITEIHLNPSVNWEHEAGGNRVAVYVFSSIALLILIIAGINFTNLSTARANKRAREVSLRKTIGAGQYQLRMQFLFESIMMSVIALAISLSILGPAVSLYNYLFDDQLTIEFLFTLVNIVSLFGFAVFIGVAAGIYPAFYLTGFKPAGILRGTFFRGKTKSFFRRNLVVFQFSISTALIIGMIVVYSQLSYIQTRSIGFDRENVVLISAGSNQIPNGYEELRNELLNNNSIVSVSSSADLPGDEFFSNGNVYCKENLENNASMTYMFCDFDFIDTYKMEIIAGRNFSKDFRTDTAGTIIMNESAVKRLGWTPEEAVGKKLLRGGPLVEYGVVGVVKNYNFRSLREEIEPMIMILAPDYITRISARILPGDIMGTLADIEQKWHEIFPSEQFEYGFMDERINRMYLQEKNMQNLLMAFSLLSILVACLGLFGLAAYNAEEKKKEIGIRKTLGASISDILTMLTKDYLKWILISFILAWPSAYYLMDNWLQNFAYRISIGWLPFALSAGFLLLTALITVSIQVLKAAMTNPVFALKYE